MTSVGVAIPSIPVRNFWLHEALTSVTKQVRPVDQISVVVDLHRKGVAETRNAAWRALDTEYVAFLDDDDIWYPHHISRLLDVAKSTGADLVYPWFDVDYSQRPGWNGVTDGREFMFIHSPYGLTPAEGHPFDDDARSTMLHSQNFIPITVLVRRDSLEQVGGFPTPGSESWPADANEDWGCWQAMLTAGMTFVHCPERTWAWRWHTSHTMGRPS